MLSASQIHSAASLPSDWYQSDEVCRRRERTAKSPGADSSPDLRAQGADCFALLVLPVWLSSVGILAVDLQQQHQWQDSKNFDLNWNFFKTRPYPTRIGRPEQKQVHSTWVCVKLAENAHFRCEICILYFPHRQDLGLDSRSASHSLFTGVLCLLHVSYHSSTLPTCVLLCS